MDAHTITQWSNNPQPDNNSLEASKPSEDFNAMHTVMETAHTDSGFWSTVGNVVSGIVNFVQDANMAPELADAAAIL